MNNASGSTLQKVNFALLLLVLACLAYLIVRDRLRNDQRAHQAEAEAVSANTKSPAVHTLNTPWPSDLKSSFAPLRPRVETNVVRSVARITNRVPVVIRTNWPVEAVTETQTDSPARVTTANTQPAGGGFIAGGGINRNGSAVTGRVLLRGTPPPEKNIVLDAACARLQPGPLTTRHFVLGADGGLADAFVYIKAGAPKGQPQIPAGALLDIVNCEFQPYVMGVQAGQILTVRNSDSILHNVQDLPKNGGNRGRNIGLSVKGATAKWVFSVPEVFVQFKSDVHPWMFAYVGIVDHPWFAVTDKNGNFSLPAGLPPGQYTLAAVHRKAGELLQQINVDENGITPITFTFDISNVAGQ